MFASRIMAALLMVGLTWTFVALTDGGPIHAQDKKEQDKKEKEKSPLEGKKGTVIGILTAKGPAFVEVKADGEEKGRKYIPYWRGGAPAKGGGPDKDMVKTISTLTVGSRLEIEWHHEEHFRVTKITVLKKDSK